MLAIMFIFISTTLYSLLYYHINHHTSAITFYIIVAENSEILQN